MADAYYNSGSTVISIGLLLHNLTHLQVNLEKLPDEIFQFYEDYRLECCENSEMSSERNLGHKDVKFEMVENSMDRFFDIDNTDIAAKANTNIERKNIEKVQVNSEDDMSQIDVEELNKNGNHSKDAKCVIKKLQHIFRDKIKFESEENIMDEFFDVENQDLENNKELGVINEEQHQICDTSVFKCEETYLENSSDQVMYVEMLLNVENSEEYIDYNKTRHTNKEQQYPCEKSLIKFEIEGLNSESSLDELVNVDNTSKDFEHNNIETETKRQLQRFDGPIIKCKIEEIDPDDDNIELFNFSINKSVAEGIADKTPELQSRIDKKAKTVKKRNDDYNNPRIKKKKQQLFDDSIIKSEAEENADKTPELQSRIDKNAKTMKSNDKDNPRLKRNPCPICSKPVIVKRLKDHIRDVHTENRVTCEYCNKLFKLKKTLNTHIKTIHKIPVHKKSNRQTYCCDHCKLTFTKKSNLRMHIIHVHKKAVTCEICGSRLASELYLAPHMRRVHYDDGKVHSCDICEKIFKSPRYLRVHMKNSHYVSSKKKVKVSTRSCRKK